MSRGFECEDGIDEKAWERAMKGDGMPKRKKWDVLGEIQTIIDPMSAARLDAICCADESAGAMALTRVTSALGCRWRMERINLQTYEAALAYLKECEPIDPATGAVR